MTKRVGIIVALGLAILLLLAIYLPSSASAPRYVPGRKPPPGSQGATHYTYALLNDRLFENDQVWMRKTCNDTNLFTFLYDLRERVILGELFNADVKLANADGSKLLVTGPDSPAVNLKFRLSKLVRQISGGKIGFYIPRNESFWVLNLEDNSAKRVGVVRELTGSGTEWFTSPDLRYGCTMPITARPKEVVLFDLTTDRLTRFPFDGYIWGWWDDRNLLLRDARQDYVLYNVVNGQSTVLFSAEMI